MKQPIGRGAAPGGAAPTPRRRPRAKTRSGFAVEASWFARRPRRRLDAAPIGIYIGLGAVAVVATAGALWLPGITLLERFGANIATEALGILVTLIVVHRFLERQERARRLRGAVGALRKSARALTRIANAWATILKGTRREFSGGPPQQAEDFFAPHIADAIVEMDPTRMRADGERWLDWLLAELLAARGNLSAVFLAYGNVIDPTYIEALDELLDDPFIDLLQQLSEEPELTAAEWRKRLNVGRAVREVHFERLVFLFTLHNRFARDAAVVRTLRLSPRTGQIGVNLPPDYDLRVHSPATPAWWHEPPAPGSLCANGGDASAR